MFGRLLEEMEWPIIEDAITDKIIEQMFSETIGQISEHIVAQEIQGLKSLCKRLEGAYHHQLDTSEKLIFLDNRWQYSRSKISEALQERQNEIDQLAVQTVEKIFIIIVCRELDSQVEILLQQLQLR